MKLAIRLIGVVAWLGACGGTNEAGAPAGGSGGQAAGGAGGTAGQGGQTAAAGGSAAGEGGSSGGQTTATGGTQEGGAGGKSGETTGGTTAGTGGMSGQGGNEQPADAAADTAGGGQGGRTSVPQADARDTTSAGTGGRAGPDAGPDLGNDLAVDASTVGNPRRVLLCDEGNRRVLLVDLQDPAKAVWSTSVSDTSKYGDGLRDIQLVGGDRVAASVAKGYVELDVKTGEIKKEVTKLTGVESMRRLPNGNTILGGNSDGGVTLQEIDSQDAPVAGRKVTFTNYSQFRMLRRTPQGTFLIGVGAKLAEVTWDKQTVWEMSIPNGDYVYQGLALPDKTIAVTSGYGAAILIIDPAAKRALTTMGGKSQPDAATLVPNFYAGFQILANGHFVVTNWEGHGAGNGSKGVQLLEYDATGLLVWQWKQDAKLVSSLHHVIVLDGLDTAVIHDDVNGVLAPVTQ